MEYTSVIIAVVAILALMLAYNMRREGLTIDGGLVNDVFYDSFNGHTYYLRYAGSDMLDLIVKSPSGGMWTAGKDLRRDQKELLWNDVGTLRSIAVPNQYSVSIGQWLGNMGQNSQCVLGLNFYYGGPALDGFEYRPYWSVMASDNIYTRACTYARNVILKYNTYFFIVQSVVITHADFANAYSGPTKNCRLLYRLSSSDMTMIRGTRATLDEVVIDSLRFSIFSEFSRKYANHDPLSVYWSPQRMTTAVNNMRDLPGIDISGYDYKQYDNVSLDRCRVLAQGENSLRPGGQALMFTTSATATTPGTCWLKRGRYAPGVRLGFRNPSGVYTSVSNVDLPATPNKTTANYSSELACQSATTAAGASVYAYDTTTGACRVKDFVANPARISGINPDANPGWMMPAGVMNWDNIRDTQGRIARVEDGRKRWYPTLDVYNSWAAPLTKPVSDFDYNSLGDLPSLGTYTLPSGIVNGQNITYGGLKAYVEYGRRRLYNNDVYYWNGSPPLTQVSESTWFNIIPGDDMTRVVTKYPVGFNEGDQIYYPLSTGGVYYGRLANGKLQAYLTSKTGPESTTCRPLYSTIPIKYLDLPRAQASIYAEALTTPVPASFFLQNGDIIRAPDGSISKIENCMRRWYSWDAWSSWGYPAARNIAQADYDAIIPGAPMPVKTA